MQYIECSYGTIKPALKLIFKDQKDDYVPIIKYISENKIMGEEMIWQIGWEIAYSLKAEIELLEVILDGYLQTARKSDCRAQYIGIVALLFSKVNNIDHRKNLLKKH